MDSHNATNTSQNQPKTPADDEFLTKEELRVRLKLNTVHAVDSMVRRKRIPRVRVGKKTTRFYWPAVKAALEKFTVKEATASK